MATKVVRSTLDQESYSLRNMYLSVFVVKTTYMYVGMMFGWPFLLLPRLDTSSLWGQSAVLACLPLGMTLGPVTGYFLAPRYGFKSILVQFVCLSLVSVLFLAFRQLLVLCVARFAAGLAIGAVLCYLESYLHDISDPEVRTLLNPLSLVFFTLGFYLVNDFGQILSYLKMLVILLTVPLALLICLNWLPESPYFDVANDNLEKAKKSVDFLHRGISTRGLDLLILLIQDDVKRREADGIFIPPFNKEPNAARVSLVLFSLLALSGFPVVFMLTEPLVREAQPDAAVGSTLSAIVRVALCPIPVAWALDSVCSRQLKMMVSSAVMSLSMAALGIFFFQLDSGHQETTWIPSICMVLYTAAFLVGFVHKSSATVSDFRQQASGRVVSLSVGFFVMCLVVLLFEPFSQVLGTAPILWTFSAVSALLTVFLRIYSPEATLF